MGGNAVIEAAADCLRQIRDVAARALDVAPDEIVCDDGAAFVEGQPDRRIPYSRLSLGYTFENGNSIGGPIVGRGRSIATGLTHLDPKTGQGLPAQYWTYGAHGVEVEVDTQTGEIEILDIATALDAGKVLNPKLCVGQVVDYKIPTAKDLPRRSQQILLENPQPGGPYGARGVAEHPMISVPSAVGNALYNALGIEFTSLPLNYERILTRIREKSEGA
jgi:CO/xanthine dehydrogenase Mo-binding subunit